MKLDLFTINLEKCDFYFVGEGDLIVKIKNFPRHQIDRRVSVLLELDDIKYELKDFERRLNELGESL